MNSKNQEKTVLITGANGYIGKGISSKIAGKKILFDLNFNEQSLNNKILNSNNNSNNNNNNYEHSKFIKGNLNNPIIIEDHIDYIFHLAFPQRHLLQQQSKDEILQGTKNVTEFALKKKAKLILLSSCVVYGNHNISVNENSICKPINPYGELKLESEKIIKNTNHLIFRLFNIYGNNQSDDFVIPKMISRIKSETELKIMDADYVRDFVFYEDVIEAIISLYNSEEKIINLGSGQKTTIFDICNIIAKNLNLQRSFIKGKETDSIKYSLADINLAKSLGWKPKITLEQGIKKVINETK